MKKYARGQLRQSRDIKEDNEVIITAHCHYFTFTACSSFLFVECICSLLSHI